MYCYKCGLPIKEDEPHRSISILNKDKGIREFYDFHIDCVIAHGELIAKAKNVPTYNDKTDASDKTTDEILEDNQIGELDE